MKFKSILVLGMTVLLLISCSIAGATVGPVNGHTLITEPNDGMDDMQGMQDMPGM